MPSWLAGNIPSTALATQLGCGSCAGKPGQAWQRLNCQENSRALGSGVNSTDTESHSIFLPLKKEACSTPEVLEVSEGPAAALGSSIAQEDYCSLGGCAEPEGSPQLCPATCEPPAGEPQLQEKLKQLQLGRSPVPKGSTAPTDSSCLLTPPTTPLNFDSGSPESPQGTGKGLQEPRRSGMNGTKGSTPEGTESWRCPGARGLGSGGARAVSRSLRCQAARRPPMITPRRNPPAAALPPTTSATCSWWSWSGDPSGWAWG